MNEEKIQARVNRLLVEMRADSIEGELYLPPTSRHFSHQSSQWAVANLGLVLREAVALRRRQKQQPGTSV